MPNHTQTILEITGDEAEVQRFVDTCIKQVQEHNYNNEPVVDAEGNPVMQDVFDFNEIIPMPDSLNITSGSSTSSAVALIKAEEGSFYDIDEMTKYAWVKEELKKKPKGTSAREFVIEHLKKTLSDKDMQEGRMALENKKKYGFQDWYAWRISNWGTKWGAYEFHQIDRSEGRLIFEYQTAWSPAMPIISKLGTMFPSLTFVNSYMDEGWGFYGKHTVHFDEGVDEDSCQDCQGDDFIEFVNSNFGYSYEKCPGCGEAFNPDCEDNDYGLCYSCAEAKDNEKEAEEAEKSS